jgi:hypothetical protein
MGQAAAASIHRTLYHGDREVLTFMGGSRCRFQPKAAAPSLFPEGTRLPFFPLFLFWVCPFRASLARPRRGRDAENTSLEAQAVIGSD